MSENLKKITFNFLGVKFTKETKMPKNYQKFLRIISQIYLLDQMKNSNELKLEIIAESMVVDEDNYEKFRSIANDDNSVNEMEVKISLKKGEQNDKEEKELSEYREALKINYAKSFEEYMNSIVEQSIQEFKQNIEVLISGEYVTNLLLSQKKCDVCHEEPLRGYVYKCFVCEETKTLCEKCSNNHEHPVLREVDYRDEFDARPLEFEDYIKQVIQKEKQKLKERLITELTNFNKYDSKRVQEKETNVNCSGNCHLGLIKGRVYRCLYCTNKFFCERCSDIHKHSMLVEN